MAGANPTRLPYLNTARYTSMLLLLLLLLHGALTLLCVFLHPTDQVMEGVPPQSAQSDAAVLLLLTSLQPWLASASASCQFCEDGGVGTLLQVGSSMRLPVHLRRRLVCGLPKASLPRSNYPPFPPPLRLSHAGHGPFHRFHSLLVCLRCLCASVCGLPKPGPLSSTSSPWSCRRCAPSLAMPPATPPSAPR
jgi:hypothetical protein